MGNEVRRTDDPTSASSLSFSISSPALPICKKREKERGKSRGKAFGICLEKNESRFGTQQSGREREEGEDEGEGGK